MPSIFSRIGNPMNWESPASQLGILLSSFFWTYAVFQVVSGWLVDQFNVSWVLAAGFLLWSAATAATGLVIDVAVWGCQISA
jgi:MFS family permease